MEMSLQATILFGLFYMVFATISNTIIHRNVGYINTVNQVFMILGWVMYGVILLMVAPGDTTLCWILLFIMSMFSTVSLLWAEYMTEKEKETIGGYKGAVFFAVWLICSIPAIIAVLLLVLAANKLMEDNED